MLLLATAPRPRPAHAAIGRAVAAHDAAPRSESGRALAGLPLRFGAPAPEAPPVRPASGGDWTLAETLGEIERRGARLAMSSRGVKLRHAHRMPDLARNVRRHARALAVWLSLRGEAVPAPFDARGWDPAVRLQAAWFALRFEAPPTPFALRPGERCVDVSLLRAGLAGRLAAGPLAASADRLRSELGALFERYAPEATTAPISVPTSVPRRLAA
ncbi:MAG: hypothetical protein AAFQ43_04835 [Bacteroidota bacterium]